MFHGSCRRVSRVLSLALEPISKSSIHYLARIVSSKVEAASKPIYRRCIAVDETKLSVKSVYVYVVYRGCGFRRTTGFGGCLR